MFVVFLSALTHIVRFFYCTIFFALDPFLLHDFCLEFAMKNVACVNGTIEITLEQIQCDIVANLQCQNCSEFTLCVSRHLESWAPASSCTNFKLAWKTATLLTLATAKHCSDSTLLCIGNQHLFLQHHATIFLWW